MNFKTIGLIGKISDPGVGDTIGLLSRHLGKRGVEVLLDADTAALIPDLGLDTAPRDEIGRRCDLAIIVGGDGTFLHAARSLVDHDVPLAGINLGHLGFLTDIPPPRMTEAIDQILAGDCTIEERAMLECRVSRHGEVIYRGDALNDVVVHKWNSARMIGLETWLDGQFVNMLRADGIIVSTPTGSTAYALSAGGPILHPSLNVLLIVPICPHTMSNRPIAISGDAVIEVVVCDDRRDHAQLTCDGQSDLALAHDDRIRIARKRKPVRLVHPAGHDHYQLLRAKLRWSEIPRNN